MSKYILVILLGFLILLASYKLLFSDSYQMSIEAKVHYEMGDYKRAKELAESAFELDKYNRMAFMLMAQSKIALEFVEFIKEANETYAQISLIVSKKSITNADRMKIKLMCEVVLGKYTELTAATKMTDKKLYEDAQKMYQKIKGLYEDVYK